jgi:hypothetical protein
MSENSRSFVIIMLSVAGVGTENKRDPYNGVFLNCFAICQSRYSLKQII